ncbi:28S ribosomal protein S9, mitochondrial-like [Oppia nitens]|uniref:28S ribosomal protein S9, mitochondrial-like n=1 Tax=Oppia nitens TaxID=1686743 RepID=UPI0023D9BD8A|nr:28S ribosomal protein S9, mitochondrial-like [Oppia nitens]
MISMNKHLVRLQVSRHLAKQLAVIQKRYKFFTEDEVTHRAIRGAGYPIRPNVPRVRFAPFFDPKNKEQLESQKRTSRKDVISKAMSAYLESAKRYDKFIKEQTEEFETGRRHLANIMGVDVNSMTQKDIDMAIQYLLPSGLFSQRARPQMKPPEEIFPMKKEAQFDINGRPFNSLYYTARPNFYDTCFKISEFSERLNAFEDRLVRKGVVNPPEETKIQLKGTDWLSINEMRQKFLEPLNESKYESLIQAMERLVSHPYSKMATEFIMEYRKEIKTLSSQMQIPELMYDENGRPFMTATGNRKYCVANVTVRGNGTGKVDINGQDITYFDFINDREQVMTPLQITGQLFKVDIECRTMYEEMTKEWSKDSPPVGRHSDGVWRELGTTAQSGAIRLGLALALRSFVDSKTVEKMRLAGLLTRDVRTRERKKWGQEGARRKYTWKKR